METTITKLLNEHELSNLLSVSVATLRRWRLLKRGPRFTKLGSSVRYRTEDVASWLAEQPTGGSNALTNPPSAGVPLHELKTSMHGRGGSERA